MKAIVIHATRDLRIEDRGLETLGPGDVRVRVAIGGVCGSDLHYFNHGGFGPVQLKEPMILGHEVAGHIVERADDVVGLAVGDLVAISPSRPCGTCRFCAEGLRNHCLNMRFYGSAMPFPHIQGAFRQDLVAHASQCVKADGLTPGQAAMTEPLSVCLHAVRQAGEMVGKRVLITGSGPIGALCILAARRAGAAEIVATDISSEPLEMAETVGADRVINVAEDGAALDAFNVDKGHFDVLFECSGVASALSAGLQAVRPRGVIVQLGLGGDMTVPMMALTTKEISLRGSFRFHEEFAMAVQMMAAGLIDLAPLITHTMPLSRAPEAFETASDRAQAMKVQIDFSVG